MNTPLRETVLIRSSEDIVAVRHRVRARALELGFSLVDQTKIVTAASELARNTLQHGGGGEAVLERVRVGTREGLRCTFIDSGPGISDLARAMQDGFTTAGGLGLGLSGAKRLSNEFTIESAPGSGTTISIVRWK